MFIAKQNLIEVFKQIHLLYSNNSEELTKQGCTQFFSGLRYFLAASAFEKRQARAWIDSTNLNDKNVFVDYVGEVVAINDSEYTCNFYNDFKVDEKDYKVGSNFYSAGFVDDSRKNPTVVYEYPSRDKSNIILKAQNGKIAIADAGVSAFTRKYLEKTQYKKALILWLLRNENIESLTKECVESLLLNRYTESVAKALFVSDYSFLTSVNLVAEKAVLKSNELSLVEREAEREEPNTSSPRQQNSPSFTPSQVIYYGVPGCGKSNKIKQDFENGNVDEEAQVVRCVFHPEYTNADFVGQIFPVVKKDGKGVDYKFKPGPFTEILRRAYLNPHREFFLVIEEINRGNAAAIFGEMFQLLDRIKEGKDKSGFGPGWSSYSILNDDVNDYIRNIEAFDKFEHVGCVKPNLYKDMRDGNGNVVDAPDENGKKEIDFSTATSYSSLELTLQGFDVPQIFRESTSIRLPPNLSILATMNTSDQNVSTLDNAFQRRFDMELVRNEFEKDESGEFKTAAIKAQHDAVIEGANCTWGAFWENINKKIIQYNRGLASTEDKRLGPWFVCSVAGETGDGPRKIPAKTFTEKVLKYLWDDAFKFKRSQVFADGLSSLEQVVSAFEKADGEKLKAVFKEF